MFSRTLRNSCAFLALRAVCRSSQERQQQSNNPAQLNVQEGSKAWPLALTGLMPWRSVLTERPRPLGPVASFRLLTFYFTSSRLLSLLLQGDYEEETTVKTLILLDIV